MFVGWQRPLINFNPLNLSDPEMHLAFWFAQVSSSAAILPHFVAPSAPMVSLAVKDVSKESTCCFFSPKGVASPFHTDPWICASFDPG